MHVHFDEAQFEKDVRNAFDQMQANPEVHDEGSIVLDRNRELSVQFAMMICRELNRGTELGEVMSAGVTGFIEFFGNMLQYLEEEEHSAFAGAVMSEMMQSVAQVLSGSGFEHGEPAVMRDVQGGRA